MTGAKALPQMTIRAERNSDFDAIHALVETAFQTARVADGDEQEFVRKLRCSDAYLPELALVAENAGELIGHVMLTRTWVVGDLQRVEALLLAPLAVKLEYRNRKIGAALVEQALSLAAAKGYSAVFLIGDPAYYQRFGFRPTAEYGIGHTHDIPDQYVMTLELRADALAGVSGTVDIV